MSKLCRILTAAILVVHFTVGCCAHHAHACDGTGHTGSDHAVIATHGDAAVDGHCFVGHDCHADRCHHGTQDCHAVRCSIVLPGQLIGNAFGHSLHSFWMPLSDGPAQVGISSMRQTVSAEPFSLPVRLHLANQVFLI
jgi:hypothetical protein